MAIEMRCPHCDEDYSFPDRRRGEKTHCGVCERGFVIGEKKPPGRSRSSSGFSEGRDSARSAAGERPSRRRRDEDDEDDDRRPRRPSMEIGPELPWWEEHRVLLLAGAAAVVLLAVGIVGVLVWNEGNEPPPPVHPPGGFAGGPGGFPAHPGQQEQQIAHASLEELMTTLANRQAGHHWQRQQIIEELGLRKDPRALPVLVPLLEDFFDGSPAATALRAYGPVAEKELLQYLNHPTDGAREQARNLLREFGTKPDLLISRSLTDLGNADPKRQHHAMNWLAEMSPEPSRAAEVARAQEKLLGSGDVVLREHAMRGLKAWGSRENTPAVVTLLQGMAKGTINPGSPFITNTHRYAFEAIRKWKDPRGAAGLTPYIGHFFIGADAMQALKDLGPEAAKDVVAYMHHPDSKIANAARDILKQQKTPDDLIMNQTFDDLKSKEAGRRNQALTWLAQQTPIDARRPAVAKALDPLLRDPDRVVRELTLKAAKKWPHRDNVPALIAIVDAPDGGSFNGRRSLAMELLGELKDSRAAEAIANRLEHAGDRLPASRALIALGSAAESALWKYLDTKDIGLRLQVLRILQEIGTKKSVPALTKAAMDPNPAMARWAAQALDAVKKRE